MTIFRVPGDFPSLALAFDSPLVQRGDTILVKEGAYNQVVIVPFDKVGIRVRGERPADAAETTVPAYEADVPGLDNDRRTDPSPEGPLPGGGGEAPLGQEQSPGEGPPEPGAESGPLNQVIPVTRASIKMVRGQGPVSPYWVTVHRRTSERAKGTSPGSSWMRFRQS